MARGKEGGRVITAARQDTGHVISVRRQLARVVALVKKKGNKEHEENTSRSHHGNSNTPPGDKRNEGKPTGDPPGGSP